MLKVEAVNTKVAKKQQKRGERMIHVRLKGDIHKRLRLQVAEHDISIQEWVATLIERELDRIERKGR